MTLLKCFCNFIKLFNLIFKRQYGKLKLIAYVKGKHEQNQGTKLKYFKYFN